MLQKKKKNFIIQFFFKFINYLTKCGKKITNMNCLYVCLIKISLKVKCNWLLLLIKLIKPLNFIYEIKEWKPKKSKKIFKFPVFYGPSRFFFFCYKYILFNKRKTQHLNLQKYLTVEIINLLANTNLVKLYYNNKFQVLKTYRAFYFFFRWFA